MVIISVKAISNILVSIFSVHFSVSLIDFVQRRPIGSWGAGIDQVVKKILAEYQHHRDCFNT